jgi:cytochrome oxidase Cu insertion factor (SCO1/SenC/PrrC family)
MISFPMVFVTAVICVLIVLGLVYTASNAKPQQVNAQIEIPKWVQDNITSEGEKGITLSTASNSRDELIWLVDHGYTYCGLTNAFGNYNQVLLAKPGYGDIC